MATVKIEDVEEITNVFREVTDYDILHQAILEDIEDTRLDKNSGNLACNMPGMGFHYVLDTEHYTLQELARIADNYRRKIDALNVLMERDQDGWTTWDILEYLTGSDNLAAPPGVAVVTHDAIDSYAYPTISEYEQNHSVLTVD